MNTYAKITRPSPSGILSREHLFTFIDNARRKPVIWISGPPGSGKTTLVASYLENRLPDSIWYQVDRNDADVATLFYYLGAAARAHEHTNHTALPLFTSEYHSDLSVFTRQYFQKLYKQLQSSFVLVFDGYQEVPPQSTFHSVILGAITEMPSHGCAIIISRSEPPASMVRLRANREMDVISWEDLRLTQDETEEIIQLWNIELPEENIQHLYDKTEGWAAGLVLFLDHSESNDIVAEVPDVSTPQLIFDYLAGEIFQNFDTSTQDFMLRTSFLSEMTAGMAEELTGRTDSETILNDLYRNHLFISLKPGIPAPFYAYHPLLIEFLHARAKETLTNEECFQLRCTSAAILGGTGKVGEAINLLRHTNDWNDMAALILEHAATMLAHGRGETLDQWLEELPEEMFIKEPLFLYWRGECRFSSAPRESRILYEKAFYLYRSQPKPNYQGLFLTCCGVMDSILYELDDLTLLDRWITVLEGLLKSTKHPLEKDTEVRITASMFMSLILRQPQHPAIEQWAKRAATVAQEISDPNLRLSVELLVAISATYVGYFSKAKAVIETMRQLCESSQVTPLLLTSQKNVESMYYMFNAMHSECLTTVYDGLDIAETSGVHMWSYHLLSNGVASALGASDLESAKDLLKRMSTYPKPPHRLDSALFHYYSAWDAMLQADIPRAFQEQKLALDGAKQSGCTYFEVLCQLAMAQVLTEYGDQTRALTHLRQVHDLVPQLKNRLLDFMSFLIDAHIDFKQLKIKDGRVALHKALVLGRENGFTHFLWWQPNMMAELCKRALDANLEIDYVKGLIRKRSLTPPTSMIAVENWPWIFRIYSLGQFKVLKNDQPLGFMAKIQRKPMELLKAIIAFDGEEIPEDRLARQLWPGIDLDCARRSLTTTLHRLRKMLDEDAAIVLNQGRITLDHRYWWIDTHALNLIYQEIDILLKHPIKKASKVRIAELAEKVFALYQGPFMMGETDQAWFATQRERLRNKHLHYIGELGRQLEESGQWVLAVDYYRRSIDIDPIAEGFYRRLMLCYNKLNRPAEVIETYENCCKTLATTLNKEPMAETKALYDRLFHKQ